MKDSLHIRILMLKAMISSSDKLQERYQHAEFPKLSGCKEYMQVFTQEHSSRTSYIPMCRASAHHTIHLHSYLGVACAFALSVAIEFDKIDRLGQHDRSRR